jgi:hypothetical protein
MPIQRLSSNAQFFTEITDRCFRLAHGGHGQPQLCRSHLERPPALPAPRTSRSQSSYGTLGDQLPFKFGKGREDAKYQFAGGGGRKVDGV